jgi:hypothetical protein
VTTEALPLRMARNRSPSGTKAMPLAPRPVDRREMAGDVEVGAEIGTHAWHDLVDPRFVDLELAQLVGEVVGVARRDEIGRRALQHDDVRTVVGDVGHQRRRCGARRRLRANSGSEPLSLALNICCFDHGMPSIDLVLHVF